MSRPPSLRRRHLVAALSVAPLVPLPVAARAAPRLQWRQPLMGTWVDIQVATGSADELAPEVAQAFAEMQRLARLMSRFEPDGPLARVHRQAGRASVELPLALMAVLGFARQRAQHTAGAFDPVLGQLTAQADPGAAPLDDAERRRFLAHSGIGMLELEPARGRARLHDPLARLDLGGVAKLPILAAGLRRLTQAGIGGVLINGGGDVLATPRADAQPWRVGVRDACQPERLLTVLPLDQGVVASSGDYERFVTRAGQRVHHIIDPASGRPTAGLAGVTLVAEQLDAVNALGPAAMVAGPAQALVRLAAWGAPQALLMHADGRTEASAALRGRLQPVPGQSAIRGLA